MYLHDVPMHVFGLMASIGLLASLIIIATTSKFRSVSAISIMQLYAIFISTGLLGGWIFHLLAYQNYFNTWDIGSGNSFLGSVISVTILVLFLVQYRDKPATLDSIDVIAPAVAVFHAIAKIGCFYAGCCYGTECSLPWAVEVHGTSVSLHPVQLYESLAIATIAIFLFYLFREKLPRGTVASAYITLYGLERFWAEFLRGDSVMTVAALSISQYFALGLFVSGLFLSSRSIKEGIPRSQTEMLP